VLPEPLAAFIARRGLAVHAVRADAAAATAEAAARLLGVEVAAIVKTMVLTDGRRTVAAIVPGDRRLDRAKVAAAIGAGRLRFASAAEVLEQTGYPPGGVAPFGFAGAVTVVVDAALARTPERRVVAGGGRPELLIEVRVADLIGAHAAQVAPIAQDHETAADSR
jgi:Cys-tRNA(Pro) deacylase